ncbi:BTB/POZ and MATH domain-containing protein 1-like [Miscanthus floridulus]|uniref:BTB/POZ and MATH domain-containing protein 1-like n=1 Tax=Miscanthus floridulus TaxID=154761 RepID=UPI00345B1D4B
MAPPKSLINRGIVMEAVAADEKSILLYASRGTRRQRVSEGTGNTDDEDILCVFQPFVLHAPSPASDGGGLVLQLHQHADLFATCACAAANKRVSHIVAESVAGSHVLTMKGYSRINRLIKGDSFMSCAFTLGGCRWSIHSFPDGRGVKNAGWISVYLHLDQSHGIDAYAKFKFSLLDRDGEPVPSFVYVHRGGEIKRRHALEQSPYLRDDCFRIRYDVTVYNEIHREDHATTDRLVAVPPSDMHLHQGRLLAGGEGTTDVSFEVTGETVAVHRCILAARSPVFMAELFGPMKEKTLACVRIEDIEARVFRALLHFVYP